MAATGHSFVRQRTILLHHHRNHRYLELMGVICLKQRAVRCEIRTAVCLVSASKMSRRGRSITHLESTVSRSSIRRTRRRSQCRAIASQCVLSLTLCTHGSHQTAALLHYQSPPTLRPRSTLCSVRCGTYVSPATGGVISLAL